MAVTMCSFDGCTSTQIEARQMCNKHYKRWWKQATPEQKRQRKPLIHGTRHGYQNRGCRCAECREANRLRGWRYKLKDRALTVEDYDRLYEQQGGRCAICKERRRGKRPLDVDHCHKTGRVRALLCRNCNTMLGKVDDDPGRLRALADYLESFSA